MELRFFGGLTVEETAEVMGVSAEPSNANGARRALVAPCGRGRAKAVSAPPPHWSTIKALFQQAIELEPDAREAFLAQACGADAGLRAEVESLLAAHDDERPFLDAPVAGAARVLATALDEAEAPAALEPGTRIGQSKCSSRSAPVAWATSTGRATPGSIVSSP